MARFNLVCAEQPIAASNWEAATRLADVSPIPVMLDEGIASFADIDRVIEARGRLWATPSPPTYAELYGADDLINDPV